jgi:hypothetical protein
MSIHKCSIFCHDADHDQLSMLGINKNNDNDAGKWLPAAFRMEIVDMCKLTSNDVATPTYGCTSIFVTNGDVFIIDTPYQEFEEAFQNYLAPIDDDDNDTEENLSI